MRKHMMALLAASTAMVMSTAGWAAGDDGVILAASGQASAKGQDGTTRKLERRSPINEGDTILTGADGKVQLRMKDGTVLALGENTEFLIKQYSTKASGDKQDGAALKLVKGTLMQVSGNMEKSAYSLETPVSTLGIRGTVFNIKVNADGSVTATVNSGAVASASQQAVASAQEAVASAQDTLDAAKAKVASLKARRATPQEIEEAEAQVTAAEQSLSAANQDLQNAITANGGEITSSNPTQTNPDGTTQQTEPQTFTATTPAELARLLAEQFPGDAVAITQALVQAFPDQKQTIVDTVIAVVPEQAGAIQSAADAAQDGGTNPPGSNDPTQETVVDQVNNTDQNNLTNTTDTETTNEQVISPP